jgi:hypothetical protein
MHRFIRFLMFCTAICSACAGPQLRCYHDSAVDTQLDRLGCASLPGPLNSERAGQRGSRLSQLPPQDEIPMLHRNESKWRHLLLQKFATTLDETSRVGRTALLDQFTFDSAASLSAHRPLAEIRLQI